MLLTIKILIISYLLSFVLLLYKLNIFNRAILFNSSSRIYETIQLDENSRISSPALVNYFQDIIIKRPNLLRFPLLMTTSFIYNKKEIINEESNKLDQVKQIIQLKKLSIIIALIVFLIVSIEWNNLDVFSSSYQKGFYLTLPMSIYSGVILGYDHLSIPFILLLSFVFPIVFISNWTTIKIGEMKYYLSTILSSHYFLIIVFLVIDILMFYVSFEIILPLFFILLGMFGGVQKFRAMYYLFLYTLWGSLFMLIEFLTKIGENGTGIMGLLDDVQLSNSWSLLGAIAIIIAFSVKTPIVPFHLWLPLAHGDANVSGSIVLASIVLKMALYGFIRILIFILLLSFATTQINMFFVFIFSLIFASTTTMRQNDLKVLVAYSSVAHMGSTLLGGFSNNHFGIFGSILFSIAHGVVSPALFIFVGALFYDRIGSRIMNYLKGLLYLFPIGGVLLLVNIFGNMGTPLTANFLAEFQCLLATFMTNSIMGMVAASSIILSACYSIYMFNRITTGGISPLLTTSPDTNKREFSMLLPLTFIMILLGIFPSLISEPLDLGLSHFLLNSHKNPFILLLMIASLSRNINLKTNYQKIMSKYYKIFDNWSTKFNDRKLAGWWFFGCLGCRRNNEHERLESPIPSTSGSRQNSLDNNTVENVSPNNLLSKNQIPANVSNVDIGPTPEQLVKIQEVLKWMNWQAKIASSRGIGIDHGKNIVEEAYRRAVKEDLDPKWLGLRKPESITSGSTNSAIQNSASKNHKITELGESSSSKPLNDTSIIYKSNIKGKLPADLPNQNVEITSKINTTDSGSIHEQNLDTNTLQCSIIEHIKPNLNINHLTESVNIMFYKPNTIIPFMLNNNNNNNEENNSSPLLNIGDQSVLLHKDVNLSPNLNIENGFFNEYLIFLNYISLSNIFLVIFITYILYNQRFELVLYWEYKIKGFYWNNFNKIHKKHNSNIKYRNMSMMPVKSNKGDTEFKNINEIKKEKFSIPKVSNNTSISNFKIKPNKRTDSWRFKNQSKN